MVLELHKQFNKTKIAWFFFLAGTILEEILQQAQSENWYKTSFLRSLASIHIYEPEFEWNTLLLNSSCKLRAICSTVLRSFVLVINTHNITKHMLSSCCPAPACLELKNLSIYAQDDLKSFKKEVRNDSPFCALPLSPETAWNKQKTVAKVLPRTIILGERREKKHAYECKWMRAGETKPALCRLNHRRGTMNTLQNKARARNRKSEQKDRCFEQR